MTWWGSSRCGRGCRFSCRFPAHRAVYSEARADLEQEQAYLAAAGIGLRFG